MSGENVFFTGSAGTGKSVLLREIIRCCRASRKRTSVTASTGIAGLQIGGSTLHSWAGIRLGIGTVKQLVATILKRATEENQRARCILGSSYKEDEEYYRPMRNWRKTEILIIDESKRVGH